MESVGWLHLNSVVVDMPKKGGRPARTSRNKDEPGNTHLVSSNGTSRDGQGNRGACGFRENGETVYLLPVSLCMARVLVRYLGASLR